MPDLTTSEPGAPAVTAAAVEFSGVTFSYGASPLFDGLSFAFPARSVTCVIGPNGCGKSTLAKLACGLLRPQTGQVLVAGEPIAHLRSRMRAERVACLMQDVRTPEMSVRALVECGRYAHSSAFGRLGQGDRDRVDAALAEVGLADRSDTMVRELSGGQRRRAHLAMTLAQDADTIILDEPTSSLDIRAAHELFRLVRQLNSSTGKAFIVIVHDLDLALRYADHLVVMQDGRICAQGAPGDVLATGSIERTFGISLAPVAAPDRAEAPTVFVVSPRR